MWVGNVTRQLPSGSRGVVPFAAFDRRGNFGAIGMDGTRGSGPQDSNGYGEAAGGCGVLVCIAVAIVAMMMLDAPLRVGLILIGCGIALYWFGLMVGSLMVVSASHLSPSRSSIALQVLALVLAGLTWIGTGGYVIGGMLVFGAVIKAGYLMVFGG